MAVLWLILFISDAHALRIVDASGTKRDGPPRPCGNCFVVVIMCLTVVTLVIFLERKTTHAIN